MVCIQIAKDWPKFIKKWEHMESNTRQLGHHSHTTLKIKILAIFFVIFANSKLFINTINKEEEFFASRTDLI